MGWRLKTLSNLKVSFLLTLSSLFFLGCASKITISPKFCKNKRALYNSDFKANFKLEKRYWDFFQHNDERIVDLDGLLSSQNIDCSKLTKIGISIKSNIVDGIINILPFFYSRTIAISGVKDE